jgi:branched-chain amino acid transport system substrate-binding protein
MFHLFRACAARLFLGLGLLPILTAAGAGELVVAQIAPFTGGVAVYSKEIKLGASVVFDSVNARGGVGGAKVRFITRDDQLDPKVTVAQFEEVARTERPLAFLFPVGPVGIAALVEGGIPQKLGVPVVGTVPAMYKLRVPLNPFIFHVGMGDDAELNKIVEHVATVGIRKIGVVFWNEPSALEAVALIDQQAHSRGLELVMKAPVEAGTDKVAPALEMINRQAPGTVIAILPVHATGALVKGLRAAGNATTVYGPSYTESFLLAQVAGANQARGVGVSQVVPNPYSLSSQLTREYQQNMRLYAPPGTRPSTLSLQGYIAAKIVVEGLRRAGVNPTPASLRDAIETLRGLDLGGLVVNYSPQQHMGLSYLNIGVVSEDGRLLY